MAYQRVLPTVGAGGFQAKAKEFSSNAINARSGMRPGSTTTTEAPGKTIGGGMMSAAGMGVGGYMAGSSIGAAGAGAGATVAETAAAGAAGGLWGIGIGAGLGLAAYFLS